MLQQIKSRENEKVKYACHVASSSGFRAEENLFFAEGKKLCFDLASSLKARTVFVTEDFLDENPQAGKLGRETYLISSPVADKLGETKTPQGIFCLFEMPCYTVQQLDAGQGILLCEQVQDPANIGAILRSAAAFGFGGVVLSDGCADPFSPKALRASMGAVGKIPVVTRQDILQSVQALRQSGVQVLAAALQNASPLAETELRRPFALLIGSEGAGLSQGAIQAASQAVYLPMHRQMESLNAAVAASVLMYHLAAFG